MKGQGPGTPVFDAVLRDVGWLGASIHGVMVRHSRFSNNRCQVSVGVIARESGFSSKTVSRHLSRLEQAGWISKLSSQMRGASHEYLCKTPEGQLALAEAIMGTEEQDAWVCCECGDKKGLQLDHIKPRSRDGDDRPDNLQILCRACNARKGDLWPG